MTTQLHAESIREYAVQGPPEAAAPPMQKALQHIRVLIVIENQLFRESLTCALGDVPELEVVGATAELQPAVAQVQRSRPAVTLAGPFGPGRMNLGAARPMVAAAPSCRFVFIMERPTWHTVRQASDVGVLGIVPLSAGLAQLVTAIRGAASGYLTLDSEALASAGSPARDLTERERAILRLTARGLPTKEIADQLFLSPGTVRNNTSTLIKKLGGRNRHEAVRLAAEQGFL